jgi:hypothetical protein
MTDAELLGWPIDILDFSLGRIRGVPANGRNPPDKNHALPEIFVDRQGIIPYLLWVV